MPTGERLIGTLAPAAMAMQGSFWLAAIDETWRRGRCVASRQSWGTAEWRSGHLLASDQRDDDLVSRCREAVAAAGESLRGAAALTRIVSRVTRDDEHLQAETTIVLTRGSISLVTTTEHWMEDDQLMLGLVVSEPQLPVPPDAPLLWCHGSAAVLLHEAAGHAAEHGAAPELWPPWLRVTDRSPRGVADLLAGDEPRSLRRESFVDVPLARMSRVVVEQSNAPFVLPDERIEVKLVGGGAYDPLTDEVTIHVAAASLVRAAGSSSLLPFTLRASRRQVASSLLGAEGAPERYPGVICSREGQELYVSSEAPLLITAALPLA